MFNVASAVSQTTIQQQTKVEQKSVLEQFLTNAKPIPFEITNSHVDIYSSSMQAKRAIVLAVGKWARGNCNENRISTLKVSNEVVVKKSEDLEDSNADQVIASANLVGSAILGVFKNKRLCGAFESSRGTDEYRAGMEELDKMHALYKELRRSDLLNKTQRERIVFVEEPEILLQNK